MRFVIHFYLFLLLTAGNALAAPIPGPASATVERVIDGDTVRMRVSIWIDQEVTVAVRVAGIDAPEIFRPKCAAERVLGLQAKEFVSLFLAEGGAELYDIERDKYGGRVVARIVAEGRDLGPALVAEGLAVEGSKGDWRHLCG